MTRVLVLRAGLGDTGPLSRRQVGRRLDRPLRAVRRLERRGIKRLRRAVRNGDCEAAPAGQTAGAGGSDVTGYPGSGFDPDFAADGVAASGLDDSAASGGDSGKEIESSIGVDGESEDNLGPFGILPSPSDAMDVRAPLVLALVLALLLVLGGFGAWRLRSRRA